MGGIDLGHIPKFLLEYIREQAVNEYKIILEKQEKEKQEKEKQEKEKQREAKRKEAKSVVPPPKEETPYEEFMETDLVSLRFPRYIKKYLMSIARYNSMTVSQILNVVVHQMYKTDVLSGIPTDFGVYNIEDRKDELENGCYEG